MARRRSHNDARSHAANVRRSNDSSSSGPIDATAFTQSTIVSAGAIPTPVSEPSSRPPSASVNRRSSSECPAPEIRFACPAPDPVLPPRGRNRSAMNAPISALSEALADRYRVERELAQGGMATVYLAEDLKHARRVAVKVLHPDLAAA